MLKYFEKLIRRKEKPPSPPRADLKARFKLKYTYFKELIASNDEILVLITDLQEKLTGNYVFGMAYPFHRHPGCLPCLPYGQKPQSYLWR
jgi:pyruvate,water dikinase